jgi:hypothetical protein
MGNGDWTPEEYGMHSLRRTKAAVIHKTTGNLRAIQILLGQDRKHHSTPVDIDDALTLAAIAEI